MTPRRTRRFRLSRDTILFLVGLAGIVYETLIQSGGRPTLLVLFGAMIGLPAFLRTDEARRVEPEPESESEPKEGEKS